MVVSCTISYTIAFIRWDAWVHRSLTQKCTPIWPACRSLRAMAGCRRMIRFERSLPNEQWIFPSRSIKPLWPINRRTSTSPIWTFLSIKPLPSGKRKEVKPGSWSRVSMDFISISSVMASLPIRSGRGCKLTNLTGYRPWILAMPTSNVCSKIKAVIKPSMIVCLSVFFSLARFRINTEGNEDISSPNVPVSLYASLSAISPFAPHDQISTRHQIRTSRDTCYAMLTDIVR